MHIKEIIDKKKKGLKLSTEEIDFFVQGFTRDEIPAYQISALLMAIWFKGMDKEETANLTLSMVNSGDVVDLSSIKGVKVDKHSTGGVGDKISLVVIPLVASLGVPCAKMSGRGLGHTGGTVDKLESIDGFNVAISKEAFLENVSKNFMSVVGQTGNLTPADKKIYALRDVTETVDSIPLIASSIMSKKIASGADAIVLDVKCGSGAFMKNLDEARKLSKAMVEIGSSLGRKTVAVITNMDEPLGHEVGNINEVKEAIKVLQGYGCEDETQVALEIASHMCVLGKKFDDINTAKEKLIESIKSGRAIEFFKKLVESQGGDVKLIENPELFKSASKMVEIKSQTKGYVHSFDTEMVGLAALHLGAGRKTKEDTIDFTAGITIHKKIGEAVEIGDTLFTMHTNVEDYSHSEELLTNSIVIKDSFTEKSKYILDIITDESI